MNILRLFETFRTYKTVKNTKTLQNNGFFFDILTNNFLILLTNKIMY